MVKWVKRSVVRPRKLPLELSEAQADKEDVHVAIVLADSEEPTSAKSIQCQYTAKQYQHVVLYARHHGVCPTESKPSILQKNIQQWLKNFHENGFKQSIAK